MSVLIKGMAMPTSCEKCACRSSDAFGGLGCSVTGYIPLRKADQNIPDFCPLLEVPDKTEINIFDIVEEHDHCHVQVLKNSVTGETSIGWWHEVEEDGE